MSAYHHIRSMPLSLALRMLSHKSHLRSIAVISVVTPGDQAPAFQLCGEPWLVVEQSDNAAMSEKDAQRIALFVAKHADPQRALLVHCLMGVSRSPSIANGIARFYGMDVWHMQRDVHPMDHMTSAVADALARATP